MDINIFAIVKLVKKIVWLRSKATDINLRDELISLYRRLISKSAFMQFLAIFTFLHIWEDVGRGYLKMQTRDNFCKIKGVITP